jgi:branched-chain amino acid transport system substrate-binding protein
MKKQNSRQAPDRHCDFLAPSAAGLSMWEEAMSRQRHAAFGNTLHHPLRAASMVAVMAAACLALADTSAMAQKGPIKVGVLLPFTGIFAPNGEDALAGFQIYLDEVGAQAAGRKIELIIEDEQGKPDVGLSKARKLVEGDKVHVVTGIVSSGVALAVNGYMREQSVPLVISADAGVNELTMPGKLHNSHLVRVSQTGRTPGATAADWGYKQGWRRVSVVSSDYSGGLEVAGSFARVFCQLGGRVVQEQYPPLGTNDYGPFLTNLDRSVDALATFIPGADGLRFGRQYLETGLKDKFPLMDIYGQVAYDPNLSQYGDGGIGILSSLHYTSVLKTPENEKFVKAFRAKLHRPPADNGPDGWVGARTIVEAAKAVNGNVEDVPKFMDALMHVKFPSPKGDISLDKYGNVNQSMYIRKVEKVGGEYVNAPIATYANQDQFWPYTDKEYLSFKYKYAELKGKMTDCAKYLEK